MGSAGKPPRGETPVVSVVIPTHNRCAFLPSAVRSAAEQSLPPREILIIDDGSTDATRETCARLARSVAGVRSLHTENRGLGAARNRGLWEAEGTWVAFLDDDDLWHPEALEAMVARAESSARVAAACRGVRFFSDRPDITADEVLASPETFRVDAWPADPPVGEIHLEDLLMRARVPAHGVVFRRDFLRRLGGYRHDLGAAEDYELLLRVTLASAIPVVERGLALYRWHKGQMSARLASQALETRRAIEGFLKAHPDAWARVGRRSMRRRLASLCREEAYAHLVARNGKPARRAVLQGLAWSARDPKLWLYLASGFSPGVYLRFRRLKGGRG
ncbi:MAG: glycosyltransferase family 2 protein [Acidobacteria bacterium]|nr:glycosyltransferase family 2 protein [Acidobacteriota bacterium]